MGIMKYMPRTKQTSRRLKFVVMAYSAGFLLGGICSCEKKSSTGNTQPVAEVATFPKEEWVEMETLGPEKWAAIEGAADVEWDEETRTMKIGVGTDLNGVRWTGPMPVEPYVVELEARRMSGSDFFCGLTFPVREGSESVSLIVGGWGGSLVGISSIDGFDASENEHGSQHDFESEKWYRIRVQVGNERLEAWIDDRKVVDADTEGRKLSLRAGPIESCAPFGLATWLTIAETRGVRWRKLAE